MKSRLLLVTALVLMALILSACGIPRGQYDAAMAERDTAQTQVASLQSILDASRTREGALANDLADARTALGETRSQLTALGTKVTSLEGQVGSVQASYGGLQAKLAKAKPYVEILDKFFFVPTYTMTTAQAIELSSMVDRTGNADLKKKLAAYLDATSEDDYQAFIFALWDAVYAAIP